MHKRQWQEQLNFRFFNHRAEGQRWKLHYIGKAAGLKGFEAEQMLKKLNATKCFEKPLGGCSL